MPDPEPLDLSAILEADPPQRSAVLDLARFDITRLGLGELLEISRALEIEPGELGAAMRGAGADKARVGVALAWIIARRREPDLTFGDVERWRIEIRGKNAPPADEEAPTSSPAQPDPTPPAPSDNGAGMIGSSESPGRSESALVRPST